MKALGRYWKVLLALILIGLAVFFYFDTYQTEKVAYETKVRQMETMILALEDKIAQNMKYADVQDKLADAEAEIQASRLELYEKFPVEMLEEDQILYVLYLESIFKEEIYFSFSEPVELVPLQDGTSFQGLLISVNYKTTYEGFQEMVNYIATDSRIASVYESTIEYDAENDEVVGYLTLILYLMNTDALEYLPPNILVPETGKDNIFG